MGTGKYFNNSGFHPQCHLALESDWTSKTGYILEVPPKTARG